MYLFFSYIANNYNSIFENDNINIKNELSVVNDSLMETFVDDIENISIENANENTQVGVIYDSFNNSKKIEGNYNYIVPDNENTQNIISTNLPDQVCIYYISDSWILYIILVK